MKNALVISMVIIVLLIIGIYFFYFKNTNSSEKLFEELKECNNLDDAELTSRCKQYGQEDFQEQTDNTCENSYRFGLIQICQKYVVKSSGDPEICDYFEDNGEKDFCLWMVASGSLNEKICEQTHQQGEIEGIIANNRDACYNDIAIGKNNEDLCSKIERSTIRDSCYWMIAKAKKDVNICEKINYQRSKELCKSDVSR